MQRPSKFETIGAIRLQISDKSAKQYKKRGRMSGESWTVYYLSPTFFSLLLPWQDSKIRFLNQ
jgi:hypothetical protein